MFDGVLVHFFAPFHLRSASEMTKPAMVNCTCGSCVLYTCKNDALSTMPLVSGFDGALSTTRNGPAF